MAEDDWINRLARLACGGSLRICFTALSKASTSGAAGHTSSPVWNLTLSFNKASGSKMDAFSSQLLLLPPSVVSIQETVTSVRCGAVANTSQKREARRLTSLYIFSVPKEG